MRLILVRHGQTVHNIESRYQGHSNSDLSELGRVQAERVGERLSHEQIDAVYSSDLTRAVDTAEAIAKFHKLPAHTDARLRECAFGEWEGLTVDEVAEQYPELYQNYRRDSITHRAPGGERKEELQARTVDAVNDIVRQHPDGTVVVVVHGGSLRAFFCHAFDAGLETFTKIRFDNCGITAFSLEPSGRWFLEYSNEICHLKGLDIVRRSQEEISVQDRAF